jgi:hypothetical protein
VGIKTLVLKGTKKGGISKGQNKNKNVLKNTNTKHKQKEFFFFNFKKRSLRASKNTRKATTQDTPEIQGVMYANPVSTSLSMD